jgi:hypothetical protein
MANILFRMVNSFTMMHMPAQPPARTPDPIHRAEHRSQENAALAAAIFSIFGKRWNPLRRQASAIVEPSRRIKSPPRFDIPKCHSGDISMVITSAHIQPIVALIAGILILIMPRFLNLVVAIYLIFVGLAGLGLFKMFHI